MLKGIFGKKNVRFLFKKGIFITRTVIFVKKGIGGVYFKNID